MSRQSLAPAYPVMAAVFLSFLVIGMALPVLPLYVHDRLGFSPFVVGLVSGSQFLAALGSRLWAGHLADTRGARFAVVLGTVLGIAGGGLYVASLAFPARPDLAVTIILAGRALLGGGESLVITGGITWALGLLPPNRAAQAIAWVGMAMFAALAIGSPLGDLVYSSAGFTGIALASTSLPVLAIAVLWRIPALKPTASGAYPGSVVFRAVALPGLAFSLAGLTFGGISSFLTLYFATRGWSYGALAFTCFASTLIVTRIVIGDLPDRIGGARTAMGCVCVETAGLLLIGLGPEGWIAIIGSGLCGAGFSLVFPSLGLEAVRRAPPESKGMAMGLYNAFLDVTLAVGSPALGALANLAGLQSVFIACAIAAALAIPLVGLLMNSKPTGA